MENIINKILVTIDPMGLIYDDCQDEEYISESKVIANYIVEHNAGTYELVKYIRQVFVTYFETCLDLEMCEFIADCIMSNLN